MATVEFRNLIKRYDHLEVVHSINLDIADGEFVVLVGPSGCGKTTCLRMVAGLENISDGEILIDGAVVNEREPRDRDIAMVFQDYALYPHMSVYQNMAFSLQYRKVPKPEIKQRVLQAAEILGLAELLERRPRQLSGGQRQRVAMGRAIVRNPKVFLFDEPLSNLDAQLRASMRLEVKKLHQRLGTTTIYVTHDQVEAMTLAERVVVMQNGYIEQIGTPVETYKQPHSLFVAGFIGSPTMNLLPATLVDKDGQLAARLTEDIKLALPAALTDRLRTAVGRGVVYGIRPESLNPFSAARQTKGTTCLGELPIEVIEPLGADTLVFVNVAGNEVCARLDGDVSVQAGERIDLCLDLDKVQLFDQETGQRLS